MVFRYFISKIFLLSAVFAAAALAEVYTGEPSNRVKINLGSTSWKFIKSDPVGAESPSYNDGAGQDVGIPHTWNDKETYLNIQSGGGDGSLSRGPYWYRKHFSLASQYSDKKIVLEFEGALTGVQVYVNGTFIPSTSASNPQATNVVGYLGFALDITNYVTFGGADNIIAVRVSSSSTFYINPGFFGSFRFQQGYSGIFRPVWMHITDKIHIPLNTYTGTNQWGTHVSTQTVASDGLSATINLKTSVQNTSNTSQSITLVTKVIDNTNTVVATSQNTSTISANSSYIFDQTSTIANPKLWYPNASAYGKPNMHKVYHIVKIGTTTVDVFESPLGIRTITWDKDFPYINGHQHYLYGAVGRSDYPGLGNALPAEIEWRDVKLLAEMNGNLWRPRNTPTSKTFIDACNAYGIMIVQPSGDGEGSFADDNIARMDVNLKKELHRDMIIRDRNNPSILAWEASNGPINITFALELKAISQTWDPINTRAQAVRTNTVAAGDLFSCQMTGCEILLKNTLPNSPSWGAEAWGYSSSRSSYDYEIAFAGEYLRNWATAKKRNTFGLAQMYLSETPGESNPYLEGYNYSDVRSSGTSATDFNRFPKLLSQIYSIVWDTTKPKIAISHHWNRSGNVRVNVFANCKNTRLLLNGTSLGEKTRNPFEIVSSTPTQSSTDLPFQATWDNIAWSSGTLRAECLDVSNNVVAFDEKVTAGAPHHIVLTKEAALTKPNGQSFSIIANGTDAAIFTAKIVDVNGVVVPTAENKISFAVTGPGTYIGSANQLVTVGQPTAYHSPGDPELNSEGGLMRITVRSQFTPGTVIVTATSNGLQSATVSYDITNNPDQMYTLTSSATNGTISASPTGPVYSSGTSVSVTATPSAGYAFSGWTGDVSGTTNPITVVMSSNKNVTANFVQSTESKLAIVNSTSGTPQAGSESPKSYDNNTGTRFNNSGALATAWIQYDLSVPATISKVRIYWYNNTSRTYPIKIEVGGVQVFSGSTSLTAANTYWEQSFTPTLGQNVKITMTANNSNTNAYFGMWETEIYGTSGTAPTNGQLQFSNATNTVAENGGSIALTLSRVNGGTGVVTVNYATANGTAISGSDYTSSNGVLTFGDGETSKTITVPILNDATSESSENFTVTLSNPTGGAVLGTPNSTTVTINDDDATINYAVAISATNGFVSFVPANIVSGGAGSITLTATPSAGYIFNNWTGGATGSTNPITITLNSDKQITANFVATASYTVSATTGANGTISPAGTVTTAVGTARTFTFTPAANYTVDQVLVDGSNIGSASTYTFSASTTGSHTISVTFKAQPVGTYTIVSSAGANGSISPLGTVTTNQGTASTFTITPLANYTVDQVLVDGTNIGAVTTYTFPTTTTGSHTISATFKAQPVGTYTVVSSAGANGSISPLGTITTNQGTATTFTITPSANYSVDQVLVDGANIGSVTTYTFLTTTTGSHSISVTFKTNSAIKLTASTATASSVQGTNTALKAIDNNTTTSRWESIAKVDPQWLVVDLGTAKNISSVTLYWEAANAKNYVLEGSNDASFATKTELVNKTNMATGKRTDNLTGLSGSYRYLRMYGTVRNTVYGYSIYEFEVYGN